MEGYPTELFVSQPVDELLLCAVCTCVARDAVEAPCKCLFAYILDSLLVADFSDTLLLCV